MADAKGKGKAREEPVPDSPDNPHLIRISNHGKITVWVAHALDFLDKHEDIPIVLHTLPAPSKSDLPSENPDAAPTKPANPPSFAHTASTVPRLISVVEIIKREYVKKLDLEHSSILTGLHQYNEIGTLEELGLVAPVADDQQDAETRRSQEIMAALQGKSQQVVKTKQTPFMKITLSRTKLTDLDGATYQAPLMRKISKSAKQRARRREKKTGEAMDVEEVPA
ncbi:hypothetical protein FB45DRAFT_789813 [Roridomyces roridus]|uniref:Uncharacterized protein n=1 Tax=Roridomyces roridus TaxID=1738132 RepID=A0AAD7BZ14_9AGAR|nr:hypothetical protein FB45DRAFT_789813 [Roridomyces roridus]